MNLASVVIDQKDLEFFIKYSKANNYTIVETVINKDDTISVIFTYISNEAKFLCLHSCRILAINYIIDDNLVELFLAENYITSTSGLQYLKNLKILKLQDNKITKIEGLNNNLEKLYLHGNPITDELKNLKISKSLTIYY